MHVLLEGFASQPLGIVAKARATMQSADPRLLSMEPLPEAAKLH